MPKTQKHRMFLQLPDTRFGKDLSHYSYGNCLPRVTKVSKQENQSIYGRAKLAAVTKWHTFPRIQYYTTQEQRSTRITLTGLKQFD